jgi:hypothetical protein
MAAKPRTGRWARPLPPATQAAAATINVTITLSGSSGTVVTGTLFIDDFLTNVPPYGQRGSTR